jgi:hypothetical protein
MKFQATCLLLRIIVSQLIKRSSFSSMCGDSVSVVLFLRQCLVQKKIIILSSPNQTYTLLPTDTNHEEKGYLKVAKLMKESENILVV